MSLFQNYDGAVTYSFGLTIDGITTKSIQEVDGLALEVDDIEVKEQTPDGKYIIRKLPGRKHAGELTFTRLYQQDDNWFNWIKQIFNGDISAARKQGTVDLYNYQGVKISSWAFSNGWPKKLEYTGLKAGDNNPLTEKLTLTHEGLSIAK